MTRMNHGWTRPLIAGLALALLAGCGMPRTLPSVRESGDRNFRYQRFDAALTDYQEYLTREPGDPAVHLSLAKTLIEVGRPAEAVEHAQLAWDQRINSEDCIETLARALFDANRQPEMFTLLRGLADSRGRTVDFIRLGRYSALAGDADAAEHAFKQAAIIDRGQTLEPQMALADFYRSIGDRQNELRRLRTALYLAPTEPAINSRIRALGEVPGPSLGIRPPEQSTQEATFPDTPPPTDR
ncbi:MAG: tetratricopeptide repeat protein [Phycisphaerales bacterium]